MANKAEFGRTLRDVARAVARLEADRVCCGDLTLQQFETLRRIGQTDGVALGAVAADLGIDVSTASRNLARLERDGYISKGRHRDDGRTVLLRLTRKGERALETLCCDEQDAFSAVYERIVPEQRAAVAAGLAQLAQALQPPGDSACCPPADRPPAVARVRSKNSAA